MTILRRLVAQDQQYENQWLKVDHNSKYIVNESPEWQFLFGPNSELNNAQFIVKIAAKFDSNTFNNINMTAYLYDANKASPASAASCVFKISKVTAPQWTEIELFDTPGTILTNSYYYANPTLNLFSLDFQGGDTLMIEATLTRLGIVYRDRIYVNHLGIYDSVIRLKQDVDFLQVTKKDL